MTYDELRERIWTVLPNASIDLDLDGGQVIVRDTGFEIIDNTPTGVEDYVVADRYVKETP